MSQENRSIQQQIEDIKTSLHLIAERKAKFISETDIDVQLIRDELQLETKLKNLEAQLAQTSGDSHKANNTIAAPPAVPCPYRGLEAFEAEHAANYFGRDAMIAKLVDKVREKNVVAVVGPSGSGKSSLVQAGLVTALKQAGALSGSREWGIAIIRPLDDPLRSLAQLLFDQLSSEYSPVDRLKEIRKLANDLTSDDTQIKGVLSDLRQKPGYPKRLVVIIDQFEETFTLGGDSEEAKTARRTFLNTLLNASETKWLTIIFTLRADFYGHILAEERFGKRVDAGLVNVLPMTVEERRAAIEKPALAAGRHFEEGLVARILDDLDHEAGELPLLEFALTELWERSTAAGLLTHAAYEEIGEVAGAIAKRAEETLHSLKPDEQQIVRRIFTRLVRVTQPEENAEDTKRRIALNELEPGYHRLVKELADARLLVTGRDEQNGSETIEVAHEALIRNWRELQSWLNSDREFLLWRQRLRYQVENWQATNKDEGSLLRGATLTKAQGWLASRASELSQSEQTFIDESQSVTTREQDEREATRQRQLEQERALTESQRLRAEEQQKRAESERLRAEEQTTAAQNLRRRNQYLRVSLVVMLLLAGFSSLQFWLATGDKLAVQASNFTREQNLQMATLLSLQAQKFNSAGAEDALNNIIYEIPFFRSRRFQGHSHDVWSVAWSPDGKRLASGSGDGTVIVWDQKSGTKLKTFIGHAEDKGVSSVAWSPNGKQLASGYGASGSGDKIVIVWDVATGRQQVLSKHVDSSEQTEPKPTNAVWSVAWSPNGKQLASGSDDSTVTVWDVETRKSVFTLPEQTELRQTKAVLSVAWSPDGKQLASGSRDKTVIIWDVETGKPVLTLPGHTDAVNNVTWSPNGEQIASGGSDGEVIIWDVATGKQIRTFAGHNAGILSAAWSPDSKQLASGSMDTTVILWDIESGAKVRTLQGHTESVRSVAWSPDGKQLASGSNDSTVIVWEIQKEVVTSILRGHSSTIWSVAWSPNSRQLASGSSDKTIIIWDVASKVKVHVLSGHDDHVASVAWSPDGKQLASGSSDHTIIVWDVESEQAVYTLTAHSKVVGNVAWRPDGKQLASGSSDKTIIVWDVESGAKARTLLGHKDEVLSVAWSPDGKQLASASRDKTIIIWDVKSGKAVRTLLGTRSQTYFESFITLMGNENEPNLGHTEAVNSVAWSPNGKQLASGSSDKTVIIWDVESGKPVRTLRGYTDDVWSVAWSPDSVELATGTGSKNDSSQSVVVWNALTGEEIRKLPGHSAEVYSVAWSPDGKQLAAGSRIRAIEIDPIEYLDPPCEWARSNLTLNEWVAYVGLWPYKPICPLSSSPTLGVTKQLIVEGAKSVIIKVIKQLNIGMLNDLVGPVGEPKLSVIDLFFSVHGWFFWSSIVILLIFGVWMVKRFQRKRHVRLAKM